MDSPKHSLGSNLALLSLILTLFLYIYIWSSGFKISFIPTHKDVQCLLPYSNNYHKDKLEAALGKASMGNKTMIISVINKAYAEQDTKANTTMLDIFMDSFWLGENTRQLRDHVLLVAVDQTAYERCQFLRLNCYKLETEGVDFGGEKLYMSQDFIKMMWSRTLFLLDVLKRGYSFIFTDMDVLWLRDPFKRLSKDESEDIQISTDTFNGNPWDENHSINTGFYFVRSNPNTIALFEKWYSMKDNTEGQKEQDVLQDLIRGGITSQLGLKIRFLDTLYFSGFCQDSNNFQNVTTVHANCCISINAKISDLRAVLKDWKRFKKITFYNRFATLNLTSVLRWSKHWSCWNSWKVDEN